MTDFSSLGDRAQWEADEAWLASSWPFAADAPCTCYDPASLEYGPGYPCGWCVKQEERSKGKAS